MDVFFFLQLRIEFIRDFYKEASLPFTERKRKIDDGEEPFTPSYVEEGEPPFLDKWIEADESLDAAKHPNRFFAHEAEMRVRDDGEKMEEWYDSVV